MSKSKEENRECPLCMEPFEMDDVNFFPCTCGYQICRFCWHRIRTNENSLCPACRKQYSEDPANFKPLTAEELQKIKDEKKQKDLQRKQKISEKRKHLGNLRVVQKNLVFVVGLPVRLADIDELRKQTYFGKFGKIVKVIINQNTSYAGSQGPSASAYITYQKSDDALRAIQAVNNSKVDGRTLKASLGTTKYCSNFLRKLKCPKVDCMYLHEIGEEAGSFTKEEMQLGKHQEYEQRLHEQMIANCNTQNRKQLSPSEPTDVAFHQKDCWPSPSKSEVGPQNNLSDSPHSESTEGTTNSALGDEDPVCRDSTYVNNDVITDVKSAPEPKMEESVSVIHDVVQSKEEGTSPEDNSLSLGISSASAWPTIEAANHSAHESHQQWSHVPRQQYSNQCVPGDTINVLEQEISSATNVQQRGSPVLNANNISPTCKQAQTQNEWPDNLSMDYLTQSQMLQALSVASAATTSFSSNFPSQVGSVTSQRSNTTGSRFHGTYTLNNSQNNVYNGIENPSPNIANMHNGIGNFNVSKLNSFNQNGLNTINQLGLGNHSKLAMNCHSANAVNYSQTATSGHVPLNFSSQDHVVRNPYQACNERSEDDDLGFDPFQESAKGLADLMQKEADERARSNVTPQIRNSNFCKSAFCNTDSPLHNHTHSLENSHFSHLQQQQQHHQQHHHHQQQQQQQQMVPPPGFSINSYGAISTPRPILGDAFPKKSLPVMNMYNQTTSALFASPCQQQDSQQPTSASALLRGKYNHLQNSSNSCKDFLFSSSCSQEQRDADQPTGAPALLRGKYSYLQNSTNSCKDFLFPSPGQQEQRDAEQPTGAPALLRGKYSYLQVPEWQNSVSNMSFRQADSVSSSTSQRMPFYMGRGAPASPGWNVATDAESPWMPQEQAYLDSALVNNMKLEKMFQQMKLNEANARVPNQAKFNAFSTYRGGST